MAGILDPYDLTTDGVLVVRGSFRTDAVARFAPDALQAVESNGRTTAQNLVDDLNLLHRVRQSLLESAAR